MVCRWDLWNHSLYGCPCPNLLHWLLLSSEATKVRSLLSIWVIWFILLYCHRICFSSSWGSYRCLFFGKREFVISVLTFPWRILQSPENKASISDDKQPNSKVILICFLVHSFQEVCVCMMNPYLSTVNKIFYFIMTQNIGLVAFAYRNYV